MANNDERKRMAEVALRIQREAKEQTLRWFAGLSGYAVAEIMDIYVNNPAEYKAIWIKRYQSLRRRAAVKAWAGI